MTSPLAPLARPCLCLVTDRHAAAPGARTTLDAIIALERWLDDAIDAGIDLVQIRERDLEAAALRDLTRRVVSRAAGTSTRIVVNDRADVAIAAGAAGVHLRADGPPARDVRAIATDLLIGRSIHAGDDAGVGEAADYLLFGHVYETMSKAGRAPAGVEGLAGLVRRTRVPVIAIGGITPARAGACIAAGAWGVAAITAFLPAGCAPEAVGPLRAAEAFRTACAAAMLE